MALRPNTVYLFSVSPTALKIASFGVTLEALRAEAEARSGGSVEGPSVLPIGLPAIDEALPDGGLPRGAVVELTSNLGLGRATSFALSACAAAQRIAKLRSGNDRTVGAWCAFLDPSGTLNAPGVARAGVDLDRLLVVRPSFDAITRVAVRASSSRAFSMIAIDTTSAGGPRQVAMAPSRMAARQMAPRQMGADRWTTVVRRIAIAIEGTDTTVLLLTDSAITRSAALPTAMRVELDVTSREKGARPTPTLRIAKERRGRVSGPISFPGFPGALAS